MGHSKTTDLQTRAAGVGFVAIGAFLLKIGFFDVLREAEGGAERVSTSMKGVMFAPPLLILGLLMIVIGATADGTTWIGRHLTKPPDRRLKPLGWVLAGLAMVPGVVLYLWLQSRLSELGFE